MKSSHESSEQFPVSRLLHISPQRKNDISFLHDGSKDLLNYGRQNVSIISAKLQNRLLSLKSHSRDRIDIQAARYKYLKNIDRKILHTARKLSPPCKESNLQDRITTNTCSATMNVYSATSHLQDKANNIPK